jgi:hypothetical protein
MAGANQINQVRVPVRELLNLDAWGPAARVVAAWGSGRLAAARSAGVAAGQVRAQIIRQRRAIQFFAGPNGGGIG